MRCGLSFVVENKMQKRLLDKAEAAGYFEGEMDDSFAVLNNRKEKAAVLVEYRT